jgi:hypothetical protein
MFSTLANVLNRGPAALLAISFWISNASNTNMPINATDPAIAEVVIIETVDVVIVDIIY